MEKLSIYEVIEHCKRHTERMENHSGRTQLEETPIGNSDIMKLYWEHRQVAEWLEELNTYRKIGSVEEFKLLKEKEDNFETLRKEAYKQGWKDCDEEQERKYEMKSRYPWI